MLNLPNQKTTLAKLAILSSLLATVHSSQQQLGPFFLPKDNLSHKKKQDIAWILPPQKTNLSASVTVNDVPIETPFKTLLKNKYRLHKALNLPQESTPGKNTPLSFLVYGNLAQRDSKSSSSIVKKTFDYIEAYLDNNPTLKPTLHVLTGNLTRVPHSSNQLTEFFTMAQPVFRNTMIASALGMRELYDQEAKEKKDKVHTIPVMANFWHNTKPGLGKKWFKSTNAQSQRSFTLGDARFIHLPIIDQHTVDGHPEIVHDFIAQVRQAHHAKVAGEISFIIIYTHIAPVTHPQYKHRYAGLFEQYDPTNTAKKSLNNAIERLKKCFRTYAVDVIFAGHNRVFSRVHWGTDTFEIPIINIGIGTKLDQLNHDITIDAQKNIDGYTISGKKLLDRNSFRSGKTKQDILGFLKANIYPQAQTLTLTLLGMPHAPKEKNYTYTILDSLVINARAAQEVNDDSYTIDTPLNGFGPFFIPTKIPHVYDVFMVNSPENNQDLYRCNNQAPLFQEPLYYGDNQVDIVSKFLNVPLHDDIWKITKESITIAQGSLKKPQKNEPFHIHICGDTRATFDDGYDIYEQLMDYIKNYESLTKQQATMQLNTGDLISFGGIGAHWAEFFYISNDLWKGRLIHGALGNHELYADPDNIYTSMIPYFANIFYLPSWRYESLPHTYLNQTTTWFDVGPIRFLHLPYVQPDFIAHMNQDPVDTFIEQVKASHEEINKKDTHLKYIVWLTHRPFIGVKSKYKPIFTDDRPGYSDMTQKLQKALDEFPPSGIIFGHQHYYASITYINKHGTAIPTITIGTGTTLNNAGKPFKHSIGESKVIPHVRYAKQDFPENLVSFIDCAVLHDRMVCRLIGAPHDKTHMPTDYNLLDTIMFKPITIQDTLNETK